MSSQGTVTCITIQPKGYKINVTHMYDKLQGDGEDGLDPGQHRRHLLLHLRRPQLNFFNPQFYLLQIVLIQYEH